MKRHFFTQQVKRMICFLLVLSLVISGGIPVNAGTKVSLNKTKTTLYVGQTTNLKLSGAKTQVKWSSSKKTVAAVTGKGKVIAKKKGTAVITAKVGKEKYTCRVTVKNPYLNKTKVTMKKGQSLTLKLTGSKAKAWGSSNKKIATVNAKGKVVAKKAGTVTIWAKAVNGKKYSCKVTVKETKEKNDSNTEQSSDTEKPADAEQPSDTEKPTDTEQPPDTEKPTDTEQPSDTEQHVHNYVKTLTKEPTCGTSGMYTYICSCGEVGGRESTDPTYNHQCEWVVDVEPTCTEGGSEKYRCTVCGTDCGYRSLREKGHNYVSCGSEQYEDGEYGYTDYECDRCHDKKTVYTIQVLYSEMGYTANNNSVVYLDPGDVCQIKYNSCLDEKLLPYVRYEVVNAKGTEGYIECSENGAIKISEDAIFEDSKFIKINVTLADNPYRSFIDGDVCFYLSSEKTTKAHNVAKEAVREIITDDMNVGEKILAVHDWMCQNITYDTDTYYGNENKNRDSYWAEGALLNKTAVCQGYAMACSYMMYLIGVPSRVVISWSMNHAWNHVLIDGEWYELDITHDDMDDPWRPWIYNHFLSCGKRADDETLALGECTGTKWRYLTFEKYLVTSEEELDAMFEKQNEPGKRMIFMMPKNDLALRSHLTDLCHKAFPSIGCRNNVLEATYNNETYSVEMVWAPNLD